jgi:release factor glutamine methyltransferase
VDKSADAVALAEQNRDQLHFSHVQIKQSDWFSAITAQQFDVIVSNPPYIDPQDPHLEQGDVRFEPRSALIADNKGLADIELIIQQSWNYLCEQAWLLLEHGYDQGQAVRELFAARGFVQVETRTDLGGNERVTLGRKGESA